MYNKILKYIKNETNSGVCDLCIVGVGLAEHDLLVEEAAARSEFVHDAELHLAGSDQ
jgi:hypothetical protein